MKESVSSFFLGLTDEAETSDSRQQKMVWSREQHGFPSESSLNEDCAPCSAYG